MKVFFSKTIFSSFCFMLFVSLAGHSTNAQLPAVDIYTTFVGKWIGYDDTLLGGVTKHIPVEIVIQEEKNKKAVRMNYTYSTPGQRDFSKITKFMELDASASEMKLWWKSTFSKKEKYQTRDLNEFAKTGVGSFTATGVAPGPPSDAIGLFSLELSHDTLFYKWESKAPGQSVVTLSTFRLSRFNP